VCTGRAREARGLTDDSLDSFAQSTAEAIEAVIGTNRSAGISYKDLLDADSQPVREILRVGAPELGMLAKVFNQDVHNMPRVQAGLKAMKGPDVIFADYGETKVRHIHELLGEWIQKP